MFDGHVVIYADGGCLNNGSPDAVSYGSFVARAMRGDHVLKSSQSGRLMYPQHATNNAAEFQIVLDALNFLLASINGDSVEYPVVIYSDSKLVVNGINGDYHIGAEHLRSILDAILDRVAKFESLTVEHLSRDKIVAILGH